MNANPLFPGLPSLVARRVAAWLVLSLAAAAWPAAADPGLRLVPSSRPTEWTIYHGAQKVLVYCFDPVKFKPYVKELYTTEGYNILRDAPSDHLHHHALMYGIKVNGINFWEEVPGSGVEKPVESPEPEIRAEGRLDACITQVIHWLEPQDAFLPDTRRAALLIERRTLTLTLDEARRETALQWKSEFEVGPKTNQVVLTGANYHGLGMRFLKELDGLAQHLDCGGKPDLSNGRQDVSQHPWGSVSFDAPGRPATIVLYGHPSNPRGDAFYFTMRTPFAYLAATQHLDQEPLVYHTGDKFQLNYLITLYPELKTPDAISHRGQQWAGSQP